jgi:hypothetical protein
MHVQVLSQDQAALQPGLPNGTFSNQKYLLGKFWRVLQWKMLVHFMAIWSISPLFGIFFPVIGMLYQDKSGNPACDLNTSVEDLTKKKLWPSYHIKLWVELEDSNWVTKWVCVNITEM